MTYLETWKSQEELKSLEDKLRSKNFEASGIKVIQPFGWVEEWNNPANDETVLLKRA